jgi:alginate O-acetyltransferase complex protein AlgI
LLVFAAGIIFDYYIALAIATYQQSESGDNRPKKLLWIAIGINLLMLGYYKYANFFVDGINVATGGMQWTWQAVILPIGISFIVFHKISYLVDVYRQKVEPRRNIEEFVLYLLLFPQLIAGPIVRYHTIATQITDRTHSAGLMFDGIWRFTIGLAKKVLIANQLGLIVDTIFSQPVTALDSTLAWIGIIFYALQIYFDFSGYTDMAIGIGMMFGFHLPENFNRPYTAKSITDFWRRWHISLSSFFRDYVYIPLGGNRFPFGRTLLNLWVVFLLCGLWHGAQWTFVLWGIYYGVWLIVERLFLLRTLERVPTVVATAYTFFIVVIGWVFFRSPDLTYAFAYIGKMFNIQSAMSNVMPYDLTVDYGLNPKVLIAAVISLLISFLPDSILQKIQMPESLKPFIRSFGIFLLLTYSVMNLATGTFNPFLYFQF